MMKEPQENAFPSISSMAVVPLPSAATKSSLAQQRFNQAVELEKQLWNLLQAKGPPDSHVRDLRSSIRDCYAFIVLEDHDFAESHDVEQVLWRLHYKQIEEFRARIRKTAAAATAAPQIPVPSTKSVHAAKSTLPRREPLQKVLGVFKSFLSEATGFYHELILKLRNKCGLPQDYLSYDDPTAICSETKSGEIANFQLSCHRCLIFLGDLARYKEYHGDGDARSRDWSVSANYYLQAISVYPSGGNPHNQLAVLATYINDDLLAVYRYFRSLAVDTPFLTARDNLIILFEKNRQQYAELSSRTEEANVPVSGVEATKVIEKVKTGDRMLTVGNGMLKLAVKEYSQQTADSKGLPSFISELRRDFRVRFVRLNGILFTRTSLETFPDVYSATLSDWEQLLSPDDSMLEAGLGSEHRGGIVAASSGTVIVIQLITILIFTLHNVSNTAQLSYLDALQRSTLLRYAFTAAFEFAARITRRCVDAKNISQSPLLPAMLVFMEWLACRPEMVLVVGSDMDEKQENASSSFWNQCVCLLNGLPNCDKGNDLDGNLEVSFKMDSVDDFRETECGFALWEDYELQGFAPLAPAQLTLDYSKRPSRILPGDKREQRIRIKRLIAAAKAVSNALEGSGKGISFDEDRCKFFLAGDSMVKVKPVDTETLSRHFVPVRGSVSEDYSTSRLPTDSREEKPDFRIPKEQSKQLLPEVLSARETTGDDEEEVIVFQPLLKEGSLCSSLTSTKFMEGQVQIPSHSGVPFKSSFNGNNHRLDVSNQYVQSTSGNSQFMNCNPIFTNTELETGKLDCFQAPSLSHVASSLSGVSHLKLTTTPSLSGTMYEPLDVRATDDVNFTGVNSLHSASTGLVSAQDWLNYTKAPFTEMPCGNWVLQSDSKTFTDGLAKSPGIIGQVKGANTNDLLWGTAPGSRLSTSPNTTLSGTLGMHLSSWNPVAQLHGSVSINGMPEVPASNFLNPCGVVCNLASTMPMAVVAGTDMASTMPMAAVIDRERKILKPEEGSTSVGNNDIWVSNENSSSWLSPGIRPPPGFGPLQRKSSIRVAELPTSSQFEVENQNVIDIEEQLQIDDYTWLDDFKPSKAESYRESYRNGWEYTFPTYESSIKTSGSIGLDIGCLPFPGMGQPQYQNAAEQHKENLAFQFQQQLLLQQNKNGGLGLDQQPYLYGIHQLCDGQDRTYAEHLVLSHQQQQQQHQQQQHWYGYNTKDRFVS